MLKPHSLSAPFVFENCECFTEKFYMVHISKKQVPFLSA